MSTLNANLRTFLLSIPELTAIVDTRIYEQHVPVRDECSGMPDLPFLWFGVAGAEHLNTLDDVPGELPFRVDFDVECCSEDVGQAVAIADIVRGHANSYAGAFGDQVVQVVLVSDQSDTYVTRNPAADLGIAIAALSINIIQ